MVTHSRILAWRIPMDEGAWRTIVHRVTESDTTKQLRTAGLEISVYLSAPHSPSCLLYMSGTLLLDSNLDP